MSAHDVPAELRSAELFHHIDMGFINRRLCLTALPADFRARFIERAKPGSDHMTVLGNDRLLHHPNLFWSVHREDSRTHS